MKIDAKIISLVDVLSDIYTTLCTANDPSSPEERIPIGFSSRGIFLIKIKPFLMRIAYYTRCSEESLILSLIYVDRLIAQNCKFMVTSDNVHKVILTSVLVAVKFYDDYHQKNGFFGKVGCVSKQEMKKLERIFSFKIKFDLFVNKNLYNFYRRGLDQAILEKQNRISESSLKSTKESDHVQEFESKQVTDNLTETMIKAQNLQCTKPFSFLKYFESRRRGVAISKMLSAQEQKNYLEICSGYYLSYVPISCCG